MPARKNLTDARKHRIARHSKFNEVKDTAERFGVHYNMVLRYRKKYGMSRRVKKEETVKKIHKAATGDNAFHCSNPKPLPEFLSVLMH